MLRPMRHAVHSWECRHPARVDNDRPAAIGSFTGLRPARAQRSASITSTPSGGMNVNAPAGMSGRRRMSVN